MTRWPLLALAACLLAGPARAATCPEMRAAIADVLAVMDPMHDARGAELERRYARLNLEADLLQARIRRGTISADEAERKQRELERRFGAWHEQHDELERVTASAERLRETAAQLPEACAKPALDGPVADLRALAAAIRPAKTWQAYMRARNRPPDAK